MSKRRNALTPLLGILGFTALAFLGALWIADGDRTKDMRALQESMAASDQEKLQQIAGNRSLEAAKWVSSGLVDRIENMVSRLQGAGSELPFMRILGVAPAKGAKAEPYPVFKDLAENEKFKDIWAGGLLMADARGKVVNAWPDTKNAGTDLSSGTLYKTLKQSPDYLGQAMRYEVSINPQTKKPDLVLVIGFADPVKGGLLGFLVARAPIESALALAGAAPDKLNLTKKSTLLLARGTGRVYYAYPRIEKTLNEDFNNLDSSYKAFLQQVVKSKSGVQQFKYDNLMGMSAWSQLWSMEAKLAPEQQVFVFVHMPFEDLQASPSDSKPAQGRSLFANAFIWILLILGIGAPVAYALLALRGQTAMPEEVKLLAEQIKAGELVLAEGVPEGMPEESVPVLEAYKVLSDRSKSAEERVVRLNESLARLEEQNTRNTAQAARELSESRSRMAGLETEIQSHITRYEVMDAAKAESSQQLENARAALHATQKSLDQKNQQNTSLSAQIQDLARQMEQQRQSIKQVEEKSSRRDLEKVRLDAINTLSSELKATLTVIKSYISTILGTSGAISSAQQEFLGVVINKSARLERLINDLVDLSQIESGLKGLSLMPTSPSAWLREILLQAQVQADNKKISLELAIPKEVGEIPMDVGKMTQVMHTLITQAIKVTGRSEKIALLITERDQAIEVRITDPGMSLPPDRAAKVFAQFHGVDSQAGPEFIGTGLRFSIIKSIVEAHGGKLWIESQVGKGKTFVLSMPKVSQALPAAAPLSKPAMPPLAQPPAPPAKPAVMPPQKLEAPKPALSVDEMANFDNIFNEAPTEVPVSLPMMAPPMAPLPVIPVQKAEAKKPDLSADEMANFDNLFGQPSSSRSLPLGPASAPPAAEAPAPLSGLPPLPGFGSSASGPAPLGGASALPPLPVMGGGGLPPLSSLPLSSASPAASSVPSEDVSVGSALGSLMGSLPDPSAAIQGVKQIAQTTFASLSDLTSMIQGPGDKKDEIIE
jgi:signal transduction histidine kinase